jgi:hypothetical protein
MKYFIGLINTLCGLSFWLTFSLGTQQAHGILDVDKEVDVFKA